MNGIIVILIAIVLFGVILLLKTRAHINEGYIDTTYSVKITNGNQTTAHTWGNLGNFRNQISAALNKTPLNDVQQMYINAIGVGYREQQGQTITDLDLLTLASVDNMNPGSHIWDISGNGLLKQVSQRLPALSSSMAIEKAKWSTSDAQLAANLITTTAQSRIPPGQSIRTPSGIVTMYGFVQLIGAAFLRAQALMSPAAFTYAQTLFIIDTIMANKSISEESAEILATADYVTGGQLAARNSSVATYQTQSMKQQDWVVAERSRMGLPVQNLDKNSNANLTCPNLDKYILKKDVEQYFLPRDAVRRDYMLRNEVEAEYIKRNSIPCWGCSL